MALTILCISFFGLLVLGVPVAFAIGLSESWRYVPMVIAGVLIVLFSIEHIVALLRDEEVVPAWH